MNLLLTTKQLDGTDTVILPDGREGHIRQVYNGDRQGVYCDIRLPDGNYVEEWIFANQQQEQPKVGIEIHVESGVVQDVSVHGLNPEEYQVNIVDHDDNLECRECGEEFDYFDIDINGYCYECGGADDDIG